MASEKREPVGGRQAYSFIHDGQFYVCHAHRLCECEKEQLLPVRRFDFSSAQWKYVSPAIEAQEREGFHYRTKCTSVHGMCSAVLGNCAYTFGGLEWADGYAVHELNLEAMVWRKLEPQNREDGPIQKEDSGMVVCGDEALCVFGGFGTDTGQHQPGATYHPHQHSRCFTNELHLFHIGTGGYLHGTC